MNTNINLFFALQFLLTNYIDQFKNFSKFKSIVNLNLKFKPAIAIWKLESKFTKSKESQSLKAKQKKTSLFKILGSTIILCTVYIIYVFHVPFDQLSFQQISLCEVCSKPFPLLSL